MEKIGHDGTAIWWPKLKGDLKYRNFHIQEIQRVAVDYGYVLAPFETCPISIPDFSFENRQIAMLWPDPPLIADSILIVNGHLHAVAYCHDEQMVYDPRGFIRKPTDYAINTVWAKIKSK